MPAIFIVYPISRFFSSSELEGAPRRGKKKTKPLTQLYEPADLAEKLLTARDTEIRLEGELRGRCRIEGKVVAWLGCVRDMP